MVWSVSDDMLVVILYLLEGESDMLSESVVFSVLPMFVVVSGIDNICV
jgi:hypothetical protein